MKRLFCAAASVVVSTTSCSNPVSPGFLARQWTESLREQQIHALFPPREDVQVGDVYLLALPSERIAQTKKDEFLPVPVLFGSLNATARGPRNQPSVAEIHYRQRPSFPPSNQAIDTYAGELAKKRATGEAPPMTVPVPSAPGSIFANNVVPTRLRQVAFPDFAKASVRGGSLAALIPIDVIMPGLGLTGESAESVTLSVPVAESYGVPAGELLPRIVGNQLSGTPCVDLTTVNKAWTPEFVYAVAQSLGEVAEGDRGGPARQATSHDAYLVVMTEVFYARSFDVRIDLSREAAASLRASLPSATTAVPAASGGAATPSTDTASPTTAADRAARVLANANSLSQKLSTPGVSASIYLADTGSIGLRRTYVQPIAIGYRGVALRVLASSQINTQPDRCPVKFAQIPIYPTSGGPVAYPMSSGKLNEVFK